MYDGMPAKKGWHSAYNCRYILWNIGCPKKKVFFRLNLYNTKNSWNAAPVLHLL